MRFNRLSRTLLGRVPTPRAPRAAAGTARMSRGGPVVQDPSSSAVAAARRCFSATLVDRNGSGANSKKTDSSKKSKAPSAGAQEALHRAREDVSTFEKEMDHIAAEAELLRDATPASYAAATGGQGSSTSSGKDDNAVQSQEAPSQGEADGEDWPEPTLEDLDRSIPQVDCEFVANLIRCRTIRREAFLSQKEAVKRKVESMTQRTTKTVTDAVRLPRLGALGLWARGTLTGDAEESNSLVAAGAEAPVLASAEVLAQLSEGERDLLQTTRPEYQDGFILLDCRTVNEITSWGIIEGAKVLPAHELFEAFHATPEEFQENYGFPKPRPDETIICYCQFGPRSLMAAQILSWMGYVKVLHFRDGYYEWGKQYNLLLRRWMEHDKESGNELRRLAAFQAGLELQREIAPEFNALPMQEAAKYRLDQTRSLGTLQIGEGLRAEAYAKVTALLEGLPEVAGHLEGGSGKAARLTAGRTSSSEQHLTQFLEQATGMNPLVETKDLNLDIGEAQAKVLDTLTDYRPPPR